MPVINPRLFYAFALLALIAEPSITVPEPHTTAAAVAAESECRFPCRIDKTTGDCPREPSSPETAPAV